MANKLQRAWDRAAPLPGPLRRAARNYVLHRAVPLTGTAGLDFVELSPERSDIRIANKHAVRNHIGGVHAAAMALVAETATGMVVGMNVRDDCVPLCKSMAVRFRRRTQGALRAQAELSAVQRLQLAEQTKGELVVPVVVTDESGESPIECEFVWAWIPKDKGSKEKS